MSDRTKTMSLIAIDGINVAANPLRPLIDDEVKRLVLSMQQIGMMNPITVRYHENIPSSDNCDDSYELIAGRHRLAAARSLGWEEIDAIEIECSDVDAKLWEIAENLHRAELTKLQHDEQVALWIKLTNEKNNDAAQVAPHRKAGQQPGGVRAASRDLGIDRDVANRAIKVASLSDEAKDAAREHGLDDNRTALLEAARETEPAAQVAKIIERATRMPAPSAAKAHIDASNTNDSDDGQAVPIGSASHASNSHADPDDDDEFIADEEEGDEDVEDIIGDLGPGVADIANAEPKPKTLYCSFCGKSQHEVRQLIQGPTVFICDECVGLCIDIIRKENISRKPADESAEAPEAQRGNIPNGQFVIRADEAMSWATFDGKLDDRSLSAARATASAWCRLVETMETTNG
jgi:ParB/RepB/Spo0J family partition protein